MKKSDKRTGADPDRDTMRPEYDFGRAVRGITAAKYARGSNVVVIAPDVLDVFPDSTTVNETLRALAPLMRRHRRTNGKTAMRLTRVSN